MKKSTKITITVPIDLRERQKVAGQFKAGKVKLEAVGLRGFATVMVLKGCGQICIVSPRRRLLQEAWFRIMKTRCDPGMFQKVIIVPDRS